MAVVAVAVMAVVLLAWSWAMGVAMGLPGSALAFGGELDENHVDRTALAGVGLVPLHLVGHLVADTHTAGVLLVIRKNVAEVDRVHHEEQVLAVLVEDEAVVVLALDLAHLAVEGLDVVVVDLGHCLRGEVALVVVGRELDSVAHADAHGRVLDVEKYLLLQPLVLALGGLGDNEAKLMPDQLLD